MAVLETLLAKAETLGIPRRLVLVDVLVLTAASLTFCAVERMESLPSTNTQPTMSAMVRIQHPTAPSSARAGKVRIPPSAPEPTWWACP